MKIIKYALVALLSCVAVNSHAIDFKSIKKMLDKNQIDLLVGQDLSLITANLQLDPESTPVPTQLGLGTTTHIGAHIGLAKNAKVTTTLGFMYDGINPVEEEDLYGLNVTRIGLTGAYDHLIPFTFHKNLKFYGSGGISLTYSKYSNIHDLDWGGYEDNVYEDQSLFEAGILIGLPIDFAINKNFAVTLTPFTDYNFSAGIKQLVGARLTVRFF